MIKLVVHNSNTFCVVYAFYTLLFFFFVKCFFFCQMLSSKTDVTVIFYRRWFIFKIYDVNKEDSMLFKMLC